MIPHPRISLLLSNYGNGNAFKPVFEDWLAFVGQRPAEIIVVDGGSDQRTQEAYLQAYRDGLIDKLQLIHPHHPDNSKSKCVLQEHAVAMIASEPYLLWVKVDTLPFRKGHDSWLQESVSLLDRSDVFCVSGSYNKAVKIAEDAPGWYRSQHSSINFCLMKRDCFIDAIREYAGEYISSGFRTTNPGLSHGTERFVIESAFRAYMMKHDMYSLTKYEDDTWSVFHTNLTGEELLAARERYLRREGTQGCYNARNFKARAAGCYYGQFLNGRMLEWRIRFGRTAIRNAVGRFTGLWEPKYRSTLGS